MVVAVVVAIVVFVGVVAAAVDDAAVDFVDLPTCCCKCGVFFAPTDDVVGVLMTPFNCLDVLALVIDVIGFARPLAKLLLLLLAWDTFVFFASSTNPRIFPLS